MLLKDKSCQCQRIFLNLCVFTCLASGCLQHTSSNRTEHPSNVSSSLAHDSITQIKRLDISLTSIERRLGDTKRTEKHLMTGTDKGGKMVIFAKDGMPVKIQVSIGLSNRQIDNLFFYQGGILMAGIISEQRFDVSEWGSEAKPPKRLSLVEKTFYFQKNKLLGWKVSDGRYIAADKKSNLFLEGQQMAEEAVFYRKKSSLNQPTIDVENYIKRGRM